VSAPILELRGYGVQLHGRAILRELWLEVAPRGVSALMGPGGAGKSTLVRTISGVFEGLPELDVLGECLYAGEPARAAHRPELVDQRLSLSLSTGAEVLASNLPQRATLTRAQQLELFAQVAQELGAAELIAMFERPCVELTLASRRRLAILRAMLSRPRLLCVDEPTAELGDADGAAVLRMLERYSEGAAVLFVTHHLAQARSVSGQVTLLAGGRIIETAPTARFFDAPGSATTATYVRTGSCSVPSLEAITEVGEDPAAPTAPSDDPLAPWDAHMLQAAPTRVPSLDRLPAPRAEAPAEAVGPRGFRWVIRGRLAGTPQPGLLHDMAHDVEALRRAGVTTLVSLLEQPLDLPELRCVGFPIPDMQAPPLPHAASLCAQVSVLLAQGETVAFHCKAGLGRTGTMLAAQLIWGGLTSAAALTAVREVDARWVQSVEQERFLDAFGAWCASQELSNPKPRIVHNG
jgi:atypical dual specificity phosphatase